MKTTIEMPDELFRKAKAVAALRGQSMKQWLTELLQKEIGDSPTTRKAGSTNAKTQKAKAVAARCADHDRTRLQGFRHDHLVRGVGHQRYAATDR